MNFKTYLERITFGVLAVSVISFVLTFTSCGGEKNHGDIVAVNTDAQRWFVEQIAGDEVEVAVLVPSGRDPETYDPDLQTMQKLLEARMYLTTATVGFESEMLRRVHENMPDLAVSDISAGIASVTGTHAGISAPDPHLLSSVRNARIIARNVLVSLSAVCPDRSDSFRDNYARLDSRLADLDRQMDSIVKTKGVQAFITTHPALSYFARDYNLRQVSLERDGKEPSPRQLHERMKEAEASNSNVLFYEQGHMENQAIETARSLGVKAVPVYFDGEDFIERIQSVANQL